MIAIWELFYSGTAGNIVLVLMVALAIFIAWKFGFNRE